MITKSKWELLPTHGDLLPQFFTCCWKYVRCNLWGVCFSTRSAPSGPRGLGDPALFLECLNFRTVHFLFPVLSF